MQLASWVRRLGAIVTALLVAATLGVVLARPAQAQGLVRMDKPSGFTPCYFNFRWSKKVITYSYGGQHRYLGNVTQAVANWNTAEAVTLVPASGGRRGEIEFVDVAVRGGAAGEALVEKFQKNRQGRRSAYKAVPPHPNTPDRIRINLNRSALDDPRSDDFLKTYVATHELGHALGLAHVEDCPKPTFGGATIMRTGSPDLLDHARRPDFNKPQTYDRTELRMLYR